MGHHRRSALVLGAVSLSCILSAPPARGQDSIPLAADTLRWHALGIPLRYDFLLRRLERVAVIDMMPQPQSNEIGQDAEPNLAVDRANTSRLVGSAFTPDPAGTTSTAPVYVSTDGGNTWALRSIVPSGNGMTGDISLDFGPRGGTLYTGILRGGSGLRQMLLRTSDPFTGGTMQVLTDDSTVTKDQPYMTAATSIVGGADRDRSYAGFNFFGQRIANGGSGQTASAQFSLDARTAAPPAGMTTSGMEVRTTAQQDMPATRLTAHADGVLYGVFYRWASGSTPSAVCDVVVVRDDNFASGASPFTALADGADGSAGTRVVTGRVVPAFPASLGQNRLVASNLSIAVDPASAGIVYVAWADSDATSSYTLHVRRSADSGRTWSSDLLTLASATNPALAVASSGVVGFLYQQLTGTGSSRRWETHLRRSPNGATWSDLTLANVPNSSTSQFMGDYLDLIAAGTTFLGVFPALNTPDSANFPHGVKFLRNVNFPTRQLRNTSNTANVTASIDPFFFKVDSATIFDRCLLWPRLCAPIEILPGKIIIPVETFPTRAVDPIPRNCLAKWSCPGCPAALCPGWYHIFLDDVDPAQWRVQVFGRDGSPVRQQVARVGTSLVISFRPTKDNFRERDIGDYTLGFETIGRVKPGRYTFGTHLEVSPYPQAEHLRQRNAR